MFCNYYFFPHCKWIFFFFLINWPGLIYLKKSYSLHQSIYFVHNTYTNYFGCMSILVQFSLVSFRFQVETILIVTLTMLLTTNTGRRAEDEKSFQTLVFQMMDGTIQARGSPAAPGVTARSKEGGGKHWRLDRDK